MSQLKYASKEHVENFIEKSAAKDGKKYKDDTIAPELMGAAALGLLGVQVARKGPKKAFEELGEGAKGGALKGLKKVKFGKYTKFVTDVAKGGVKKAKKNNSDWNVYRDNWKDLNDKNLGYELKGKEGKAVYKDFRNKVSELDKYVEDSFEAFKQETGINKKKIGKLDNSEKSRFEKFLKDRVQKENYGEFAKSKGISVDLSDLDGATRKEFDDYVKGASKAKNLGLDPAGRINGAGGGDMGDAALKGIGLGGTAAGTNFALHALGQKYFDKTDDDKVRALIRESYESSDGFGKVDENKKYPVERAALMKNAGVKEKLKIDPAKFDGLFNFEPPKSAKGIDFSKGDKMKAALKSELKEMLDVGAGGAADAAIIAGLPIGASLMVGKNIRNGFTPIGNSEDPGMQDIVIDVPINGLAKKAAIEMDVESAKPVLNKRMLKWLENRKKTFYRAVPWAIGGGLVLKALGDKANFVSGTGTPTHDLPPPQEGYARMIIQRKPQGYNSSVMDAAMAKSAGEEVLP